MAFKKKSAICIRSKHKSKYKLFTELINWQTIMFLPKYSVQNWVFKVQGNQKKAKTTDPSLFVKKFVEHVRV